MILKERGCSDNRCIVKTKKMVLILGCLLILNGCRGGVDGKYIFQNDITDCMTIQIMYNQESGGEGVDEDKIHILYELEKEEFEAFMNDIYELETEKDHRHPPFWGWGEYIVKVTYKNGDIEILGSEVIEYRKKGDDGLLGYGEYRFKNQKEFIYVLEKYCDIRNAIENL